MPGHFVPSETPNEEQEALPSFFINYISEGGKTRDAKYEENERKKKFKEYF